MAVAISIFEDASGQIKGLFLFISVYQLLCTIILKSTYFATTNN
jgi:hypothetical protein